MTNDPRAAIPPPPPRPDPQIVEQRVREMMLPEGQTGPAVAGYLFFPQYKLKRHKGVAMDLHWSTDDVSAILSLPEK